MKALPTVYPGTTFRSRLEADWATTLDDRKITWQYEPEGYELADGQWYLPDFWLPSARAWLEVKGSHNERVTLVESFAEEHWRNSQLDTETRDDSCRVISTYDADAPMILIGCEGKHWDDTVPPPPDLIGVMGPGKRYSVAMVICPACKQGTVVALWQRVCRACGKTHIDGMDAWMKTAHASALGPFRKVARPRPPKV